MHQTIMQDQRAQPNQPKRSSRTEQLFQDIRKTPVIRQLIPMEAGIGFPIPVRKANQVYITLPFFGLALFNDERKTSLFPPFATLTIDWFNQVPVEYVNLRFRSPDPALNWEDPVGTFPHAAVEQMTIGDYKHQRYELFVLYDELFERLAQGSAFSDDWTARFKHLLRMLMEPALEPYYRAIAPKFFDRFLIDHLS